MATKPTALLDMRLVLAGGGALILSVIVIILMAGRGSADSALLFIGFLLASIVGLALAAAIYKGLGHDTSSGDAFGLPNGSIRALLAISIMVLFVVFGLPFIRLDGAPSRMSDEAFETVTAPCAAVPAELLRYRGSGIVAIPDYRGCPQAASLNLYRQTREFSANQLELGKQILTAVITLLTTIIGFYFGSQSAIAAASAAAQGRLGVPDGGGGDHRPGGGETSKGSGRSSEDSTEAEAAEAEAARKAEAEAKAAEAEAARKAEAEAEAEAGRKAATDTEGATIEAASPH
jgi:hypothetical protein